MQTVDVVRIGSENAAANALSLGELSSLSMADSLTKLVANVHPFQIK